MNVPGMCREARSCWRQERNPLANRALQRLSTWDCKSPSATFPWFLTGTTGPCSLRNSAPGAEFFRRLAQKGGTGSPLIAGVPRYLAGTTGMRP